MQSRPGHGIAFCERIFTRAASWGLGFLCRGGGGVSKANFQSRSRVPSLIKEPRTRQAACALSWILKQGAQEKASGDEWPPRV